MEILAFAVLVLLCLVPDSRGATPKNVLMLVIDDLRSLWSPELAIRPIVPNIERLAAQSVYFPNTHAQVALCCPSRSSFLTGRRPNATRVVENHTYWRKAGPSTNFTSLPQYFKEQGYRTASFGKVFHYSSLINDDKPYSWTEAPYHAPTLKYRTSKLCPSSSGAGPLGNNIVCPVSLSDVPEGTLPDIQIASAASDFLNSLKDTSQPFFAAVGFHKPHVPLRYPKEFDNFYPIGDVTLPSNHNYTKNLPDEAWDIWHDLRMRDDVIALNLTGLRGPLPPDYGREVIRSYFAAVTYMDSLVGEVLNALVSSGLSETTSVILFGDHGWALGEHQEWSKFSVFDVATRVPLFIRVPGITYDSSKQSHPNESPSSLDQSSPPPGRTNKALVELVDIFPTLTDVSGLKVPPSCGKLPVLNSESSRATHEMFSDSKSKKDVELCLDGVSLSPLLRDASIPPSKWKDAVFSQYPRPLPTPSNDTDLPAKPDMKVMGYSVKTLKYRYTEWVGFRWDGFVTDWSHVFSRELYTNEREDVNVAGNPYYSAVVKELSKRLREGWPAA